MHGPKVLDVITFLRPTSNNIMYEYVSKGRLTIAKRSPLWSASLRNDGNRFECSLQRPIQASDASSKIRAISISQVVPVHFSDQISCACLHALTVFSQFPATQSRIPWQKIASPTACGLPTC